MNMKIKYNRTSTINQDGERFKLDKDFYDLTLFDSMIIEVTEGMKPYLKFHRSRLLQKNK